MCGYLESEVGDPCVHVVWPFTTYRLGLSVPNKVSIQITIIILKLFRIILYSFNLITLYYFTILYCIFSLILINNICEI